MGSVVTGIRKAVGCIRFLLGAAALWLPGHVAAQPQGLLPPADDRDTVAWNGYFSAWEALAPADARLWIDRFNHYLNRSRRAEIVLRNAQDTLLLSDELAEWLILADSTGAEAGRIGERIVFDDALFARAIAAIDRGIELHPDRIDMYLGRAAAFAYAERYREMAEALCALIARAGRNGGRWIGTDDLTVQPIPPQELIADYLQDYVNTLFDVASPDGGDEATHALGRLARCEAEYAPSSAVALNNLGAWHYGAGRIDEALDCFVRASEADPSDRLLIYNVGYLFRQQGEREQARTWWRRLLDSPDEAERQRAGELLRELDAEVSAQ